GIKGGVEAGGKFIDALNMILRLVNIGDAKSLACHPASTTHRQLSPEELARAGISEDLVRISVGIEHIDDIIADIDQALAKAYGIRPCDRSLAAVASGYAAEALRLSPCGSPGRRSGALPPCICPFP